jgi:hypothetical protein
MSNQWRISGLYFENCNCRIVCPCLFLGDPSEGNCTTVSAWHIEKGHYSDNPLDGLNVVMAIYCPGNMAQVKWKVALYLDETANQIQKDALTQIFTGNVGGHPAVLVSFVGEVLGIRSLPIEFRIEGKRRVLLVPDIIESDIEAIAGEDGTEVTFSNTPLCITPGQTSVVAESKRLCYRDYGLQWETSKRYGSYSPFAYQGT